jgi:hypothetical protein
MGTAAHARFDWYQGSLDAFPFDIAAACMTMPGAHELERGDGFNRYPHALRAKDAKGNILATILHGGTNGSPNVLASGPSSPDLARALASAFGRTGALAGDAPKALRITRADSCVDLRQSYQDIISDLRRLVRSCGMSGQSITNDDPDKGCTYYVGSTKAAVRIRVYEKGKELLAKGEPLGDYSLDTVRFEIQLRPNGPMREQMAHMTAAELWGATNVSRWIAMKHLDANPTAFVMQRMTLSPYERRLEVLNQQYGKTFDEMLRREGSWDAVGDLIAELRGSAGDVVHDGVVRRPGRDVQ